MAVKVEELPTRIVKHEEPADCPPTDPLRHHERSHSTRILLLLRALVTASSLDVVHAMEGNVSTHEPSKLPEIILPGRRGRGLSRYCGRR